MFNNTRKRDNVFIKVFLCMCACGGSYQEGLNLFCSAFLCTSDAGMISSLVCLFTFTFSLFEIDCCSLYACCVLVDVYLLHPLNPWMLVFILFTHQYYLSMRAIRVAFRCLYVRVLKCALWRVGRALGNRLGPRLLLPRIKVSAALITSLPASAVFYSVPAAVSEWRNSPLLLLQLDTRGVARTLAEIHIFYFEQRWRKKINKFSKLMFLQ